MKFNLAHFENVLFDDLTRWLRKVDAPKDLLVVRPYFYDSCAPECYLNCSFITRETARSALRSASKDRFCELWHCGQELSDKWLVFPESSSEDHTELNRLLPKCYEFICDDENIPEFAAALCRVSARINQGSHLESVYPGFCGIVPADGTVCYMDDETAIRESLTESQIAKLLAEGFLDSNDQYYGIYWHEE